MLCKANSIMARTFSLSRTSKFTYQFTKGLQLLGHQSPESPIGASPLDATGGLRPLTRERPLTHVGRFPPRSCGIECMQNCPFLRHFGRGRLTKISHVLVEISEIPHRTRFSTLSRHFKIVSAATARRDSSSPSGNLLDSGFTPPTGQTVSSRRRRWCGLSLVGQAYPFHTRSADRLISVVQAEMFKLVKVFTTTLSHECTTITKVRQSTVVGVLSGPQSQLVTLIQYELADVDAIVKLNWLSAGQQRHVARICGRRNGSRHVLANECPLKCISEIVSCRQVETQVRNSCNTGHHAQQFTNTLCLRSPLVKPHLHWRQCRRGFQKFERYHNDEIP